MAELHIIGQIVSGKNFGNTGAFCKWSIEYGSGWKKIEGPKSGQTQVDTPIEEEVAQWCHPIDCHLVSKGLQGWPKLILEVRRQDQYGRSDLAGYGTCHVPPTPGTHILEVPTWRPAGSFKDEIVRYFLGGAAELTDSDFVVNSPERYRLRTVPSGSVTVELSIVLRNFDKFGVQFIVATGGTGNSSVKVVAADHMDDVEVVLETYADVKLEPNSSIGELLKTTEDAIDVETVTYPPTEPSVTTVKSTKSGSKTTVKSATNSTSTTTMKSTSTTTAKPTSTTTAKPTSTTTATTTKKPVKRKSKPNKRRICGCDLHINSCDMNCCCDLDCKEEEKKLFAYCIDSDYYDPKDTSSSSYSCFRNDIFYRAKSPYIAKQINSGLFCVVTENVESTDELPSEPEIDLKHLMQKQPKFSWKAFEWTSFDFPREPYRYGSTLLKVTGSSSGVVSSGPFYMPGRLYGSLCMTVESVKFLMPTKNKCIFGLFNLERQCSANSELSVNHFLKNTAFVSNPGMENLTDSLVPLVTALCIKENGKKLCSPCSPITDPLWDKVSGTCLNALEDLELTFIHAGTQGLLKVVAKVTLTNLDRNTTFLFQHFSANFVWGELVEVDEESVNATTTVRPVDNSDQEVVDTVDYSRSGNPGYILGKPVLMGTKIFRVIEKNQTESKIESKEESFEAEDADRDEERDTERSGIALDTDPGGWMTIHKPGRCSDGRRHNVFFGITHQTECVLNVSEATTCDNLQERITATILGQPRSNFTNMYVSAFGNPDAEDVNEWVPVFVSDLPSSLGKEGSWNPKEGCDGIVSTMKIKVAYAYVGSVRFPQAKIVGVLYEFGDSYSIPRKLKCPQGDAECDKYDHHVSVVTSVVFLDVTKAPIPRVGQWPVVSIKLPHDFFYPFSTTSHSTSLQISFYSYSFTIVLSLLCCF